MQDGVVEVMAVAVSRGQRRKGRAGRARPVLVGVQATALMLLVVFCLTTLIEPPRADFAGVEIEVPEEVGTTVAEAAVPAPPLIVPSAAALSETDPRPAVRPAPAGSAWSTRAAPAPPGIPDLLPLAAAMALRGSGTLPAAPPPGHPTGPAVATPRPTAVAAPPGQPAAILPLPASSSAAAPTVPTSLAAAPRSEPAPRPQPIAGSPAALPARGETSAPAARLASLPATTVAAALAPPLPPPKPPAPVSSAATQPAAPPPELPAASRVAGTPSSGAAVSAPPPAAPIDDDEGYISALGFAESGAY